MADEQAFEDGTAEAMQRLAIDGVFAPLRAVLLSVPGITDTLAPPFGLLEQLDADGVWVQAFDIEPSERGLRGLQQLANTLIWCSTEHERLGLPPFVGRVVVAGGFTLEVELEHDGEGALAKLPPDALARAIAEHIEPCTQREQLEEQHWENLLHDLIADHLERLGQVTGGSTGADAAPFEIGLLDTRTKVVGLFRNGRPVARYRVQEEEHGYRFRRCDD